MHLEEAHPQKANEGPFWLYYLIQGLYKHIGAPYKLIHVHNKVDQ